MRRIQSILLPLIVLLFSFSAASYAQLWSGIINSGRAIDWSSVGAGPIPPRTTICATLNPGASSSQINSAIQSCPAGQTVFLNAGTYNVSLITWNNKSNVTLRGAGAEQTIVKFSGGACHGVNANVCMDSGDNNSGQMPGNTANWTAGYARGTTVITLSSTTNLKVGSPIILDQVDDLTDGGGIYVCQENVGVRPGQSPQCSDDGASGGDSGAPRGAGSSSPRGMNHFAVVTAINGNQVTISPGLYMPNWNVAHGASPNPGAWWSSSPAFADGIEDMSLDYSGNSGQAGIMMLNCTGCWVKGVRSIKPGRSHVWLWASNGVTVRDSYFFGNQGSQSQSYGIETFPAGNTLVENDIFHQVTGPIVLNGASPGTVVAYNYSINDYYTPTSFLQVQVTAHAYQDNVLVEGNVGAGFNGDLFHGSHHFFTAFRNYYNGWDVGRTDHTIPINLLPLSRYFNIIGNVLGRSGYHNNYQATPGSGNADTSIYALGTGSGYAMTAGDAKVASTVMRWGNYDTVNNAVRFVSTEVPSSDPNFPNAVPASQTLPASFYLSAKPSWWPAATPWPPIGPDVTSGTVYGSNGGTAWVAQSVGGHANDIPALDCYKSVMGGPADGSGSMLSFNANSCYGSTTGAPAPPPPSGGTPAPPTNLGAVVQ